MEVLYIISQILVIVQYSLLMVTYQVKTKKKILIFNAISSIAAALSFLLLSAYSGCAISILALLRNYLFYKQSDKKNIKILVAILIILIGLTIVTYDGILSIMPSVGFLIYTLSIWQNDTKIYRMMGMLIEMAWLTYHIYVLSIFGIILEGFLMISVIIGLMKEIRKK